MYLPYISPPELWRRFYNFFNPSKKYSFGCAANMKSQRLISTPTYARRMSLKSRCLQNIKPRRRGPENTTANASIKKILGLNALQNKQFFKSFNPQVPNVDKIFRYERTAPRYPLDGRLGRPQSRSGRCFFLSSLFV
jgi:hypothetical protein